MRFRIDLKIFLFLILFYFTKQIETYVIIIVFAIIHELGHLMAGLIMGMKPEKIELMPYGISISFKLKPKDYNKKILKANLLEIKKILVAIAGPFTNLLIIIFATHLKIELFSNLIIIYANLLLILFNLVPIYPLDGGRILKEILHIFLGKRKAERYTNSISFIILIILTFIASIGIYYMENISIFIITIFLWGLYLKQDKIDRNKNKIYDLIEKLLKLVKINSKLILKKKENANDKKIVNNQKGVSLVTLTITVIVILILTGIVLYNVKDNLGVQKLKSMQADIENLRDKIESYYIEYGNIPAKIEYTNITNIKDDGVISNEVDTGKFYIIDLSAIDNLTLTYGKDYDKIESEQQVDNLEDIYIINEDSHNIFMLKE